MSGNKYFNSTTLVGRANVAKATYASFALVYLFYRLRRGSGKKPPTDKTECPCPSDKLEPKQGHESRGSPDESEDDCPVCRDRSERTPAAEHGRQGQRKDSCRDDPPPPPPPSSGSGAVAPRRKCPCEDTRRQIESALNTYQRSTRNDFEDRIYSASSNNQPPDVEQLQPARELVIQMHDTVSRVVRNVIGAVMGTPTVTTGGSKALNDNSSDDTLHQHEPPKQLDKEHQSDPAECEHSASASSDCYEKASPESHSEPQLSAAAQR